MFRFDLTLSPSWRFICFLNLFLSSLNRFIRPRPSIRSTTVCTKVVAFRRFLRSLVGSRCVFSSWMRKGLGYVL